MAKRRETPGERAPAEEVRSQPEKKSGQTEYSKGGVILPLVILGLLVAAVAMALLMD